MTMNRGPQPVLASATARALRRALRPLAATAAGLLLALGSSVMAQSMERNPVRSTRAAAALDELLSTQGRVVVTLKASAVRAASALAAARNGDGATSTSTSTSTSTAAAVHPMAASRLGTALGLALSDGRALDGRTQVMTASGLSSAALAQRLAGHAEVEKVVIDRRVYPASVIPSDPYYADGQTAITPASGQWYLRPNTGAIVSSIDVQPAWRITDGDPSLVVAVLDTGIRMDHPDLKNQLVSGYDFISDTVTSNDGDGWDADPSDPGDWLTSADLTKTTFKGCKAEDSSWHGSQVSGLIAAETGNGIGMASVGRHIRIQPVRVLGKCGGYESDIAAGMLWAAGVHVPGVPDNTTPARVLNLSLGGANCTTGANPVCSCSTTYSDAISRLPASTVVVAAAGNEALAVDEPGNCAGVISVAAIRHVGTKVGFSSLGPEVAIAAPGGNCVNTTGTCLYPILTTLNAGTTVPGANTYSDGDAHPSLGTSFSTPLVSGVVALMLSANPALTRSQVRTMLQQTARAFPTTGGDAGSSVCQAPSATAQDSECYCTTSTCGAGMLDAGQAVLAAAKAAGTSTGAAADFDLPALGWTGTAITLDGTASAGIGGAAITSYAWSITQGSSLAAFSTATNIARPSLLPSGSGVVTVRLQVVDANGKTGVASRTFSVVSGLPTAVITGASSTVTGSSLTLSGADSSAATGRSIASYAWTVSGTGLSISGSAAGASVTLAAGAAGTATVQLTVTDNVGNVATSSQTVTVAAASSGGGGGGLGMAAALSLLLALAALARNRRQALRAVPVRVRARH